VSFRTRILFALGAVGLVPLSLAASFSFAASKTELERTVGRAQAAAAAEAARGCERFIARALESLRMSAGMLPLGELTRDETAKVLGIPYRQLDFVRALALLDYDGALLAPPVAGPRLAGVPGVVRVQALGGERYRVDCQRDLRADIARRLAPEVELIGIHFAAPSLTEVYNRYFEEARLAAQ